MKESKNANRKVTRKIHAVGYVKVWNRRQISCTQSSTKKSWHANAADNAWGASWMVQHTIKILHLEIAAERNEQTMHEKMETTYMLVANSASCCLVKLGLGGVGRGNIVDMCTHTSCHARRSCRALAPYTNAAMTFLILRLEDFQTKPACNVCMRGGHPWRHSWPTSWNEKKLAPVPSTQGYPNQCICGLVERVSILPLITRKFDIPISPGFGKMCQEWRRWPWSVKNSRFWCWHFWTVSSWQCREIVKHIELCLKWPGNQTAYSLACTVVGTLVMISSTGEWLESCRIRRSQLRLGGFIKGSLGI